VADRVLKLAQKLILAGAAAVTLDAAASTIEEAKLIVDRAEPLQCELLALQARLKSAPEESEESIRLSAEIGEARKRLKLHYLATMDEYIAVMKTLPFEQRKAVYAYTEAVAARCARRSRD
jgi:hypothetical protein